MTQIGIFECGQTQSDWLQEHGEMADPFPPFLRQVDPSLVFKIYKAHRGEFPQRADECDAWLITGSPSSVSERPVWQDQLAAFLVQAVQQRPVVGICFGHQLLHDALGGAVERSAKGWGVGVQTYGWQAMPDWAPESGEAQGLRLIAFHQDQVTKPAPGSQILAGNAFCPVGITTIGDNALTIQAHPEMTTRLARALYEIQRPQLGDTPTDEAVQSLGGDIDARQAAQWVLAFLRHRMAALACARPAARP
jgi:GMP synthase-like glutamine amidotransferase